MQNDKTTLKDLSIFSADGEPDVFGLMDHTTTQAGKETLRRHIQHPPDTYEKLIEVQEAVKFWAARRAQWPTVISNGTLVMIEAYFESADQVAAPPVGLAARFNTVFQKLLNKREYFFIRFSLSHLRDFLQGCSELAKIAGLEGVPPLLQRELALIAAELQHRLVPDVLAINDQSRFIELSQLNYRARREMKNVAYRLMHSYARLDAWQSLARATEANGWTFPELLPASPVFFDARGLIHPLLQRPVPYDMALGEGRNFLLLTGANMSGKTTFMRALGVGALLAHLGTGVPARSLRISFLQGIITNMHVEDNILRGESYFYAEVQRMKQTAEKLQQRQPHLVLMDELFKGTNVHDAYECTRAVIDGLLLHPSHLMLLSTHLYEVAQQFTGSPGIRFAYFVTEMAPDGNYVFTYEIRSGISNDRIGYRILQKEGVIALLNGTPDG